jgi:Family of unknown function (DUF6502)
MLQCNTNMRCRANCNKELVISIGKSTICDVGPNNESTKLRSSGALAELGALAGTIQALFQPFARMLARRGIGARGTSEITKRAYIAATIDVLRERGLPTTPSRLSVFTGLTQREIEQVQSGSQIFDAQTTDESALGEVGSLLTAWHEDPRYCVGFTGTPMELEYDAVQPKPSFTSLARELTPNRAPKDILEILVRAGAARINEASGRIQVVSRCLIAEPDSLESIGRLGQMVRNLAETSYYNSQTADLAQRRFNRNTIADFSLHPDVEEEFRRHVQVEGQRFLVALDNWLKKQQRAPSNGRRVGVAAFYFVEPREDAGDEGLPEGGDSSAPPDSSPNDLGDDANSNVIDVLNYKGPKT